MTPRMIALLMWALPAVAAVAAHVVLTDTVRDSGLYPGTTHEVTVTVPDAYDGTRPAALYVGLDGPLCRAPQVMDSLMDRGAMPVTIGVFVQPGVVRDSAGQVLRYNRSNEFDMIDDRFVTFLDSELLPVVERLVTPDGRPVRLSDRPQDRCIAGLSSGGIAAFMAAWWRPDLFGKVFSGVGTFVAMRGGNEVAALVRKAETRPVKVFLQDGTRDVWNPVFGHWYEGNRLLASALDFAGYDLRADWSDGAHNVARATAIFPEVMTHLWADEARPRPSGNTLVRRLVEGQSREWRQLDDCVGDIPRPGDPPAVYPDGTLAVKVVEGDNNLWQVVRDGDGTWRHAQRFYWLHTVGNRLLDIGAMAFDGEGQLWVATDVGLQVCDQNGRVRAIFDLPRHFNASQFATLTVEPRGIVLTTWDGARWGRDFNVVAPRRGVRPASQGQG